MIDPYVILAPLLLLPVVWLLRFIGCTSFAAAEAPPTFTISGQVMLSGAGLAGVTVALSGSETNSATTDTQGKYSFASLPAGIYTVTPSLAGYSFSLPSQTFMGLNADQTLNFTATLITFAISGQVVLSGAALSGVAISLSGSKLASATTDATGKYSFPGLTPAGNYTVVPALIGYTFTPPTETFNNLSSDQTASFIATAIPVVNLALGKPAVQSSTNNAVGGNPVASSAVDGNTDGIFSDGSVTHTNLEANAWWQVDLGLSAYVTSIEIWNRTDGVPERLSDYWVFLSDITFGPNDTPTTLQGRAGTFSNHQTSYPKPSTTITVKAQGRFVRVQLSGTNFLSLAEVQVFGFKL